jgi:hypothetical protein
MWQCCSQNLPILPAVGGPELLRRFRLARRQLNELISRSDNLKVVPCHLETNCCIPLLVSLGRTRRRPMFKLRPGAPMTDSLLPSIAKHPVRARAVSSETRDVTRTS